MKKRCKILFFAGMILSLAALEGSGCSFKKILPFEDNPVSVVNDDAKREKAYLVQPKETPTPTPLPEPTGTPVPTPGAYQSVVDEADALAVQYDYDNAIALVETHPDYAASEELQQAAQRYRNARSTCVDYPLEKITHIFFHTLVADTALAFDGDEDSAGYNQMMTTISEFNAIMQSMYDRGYVIVSPHDMATVSEDGTVSRGHIYLPQGKTPFVLSQDDVSYYHYMDGDGFATRLVVTDAGEVKCEYKCADGTVLVGDYDMVPLLDSFIKEHPDFSYHGRKGILAMTGYNGVLGYRTDIAYKTRENLQENQAQFLQENPDFDYDKDVAEATRVAEAMKANGWEFASHTWGHRNATDSTAEELETDDGKWQACVAPILGKTDMVIFAFGADIGGWEPYTMDNPKFAYFKSHGYHYYCNVDSSQYWVQVSDQCFRQGRRNLDGYRMYYNSDMCSDLFDIKDVWDRARPRPVPPMGTEGAPDHSVVDDIVAQGLGTETTPPQAAPAQEAAVTEEAPAAETAPAPQAQEDGSPGLSDGTEPEEELTDSQETVIYF